MLYSTKKQKSNGNVKTVDSYFQDLTHLKNVLYVDFQKHTSKKELPTSNKLFNFFFFFLIFCDSMNKMVVFLIRHPRHNDVSIRGLVDGDYLFDEQAKEYADGIIQYYQGDNLRWEFPANQFMKHSIKWNAYEGLKDYISSVEEDLALKIFEGDRNVAYISYEDFKIDREVLTW